MGGDPEKPRLWVAASLRETPKASDPFRIRLGEELAGACGGALGPVGDFLDLPFPG